jgi:hypothetical protein
MLGEVFDRETQVRVAVADVRAERNRDSVANLDGA